jgi:hypothetical protein
VKKIGLLLALLGALAACAVPADEPPPLAPAGTPADPLYLPQAGVYGPSSRSFRRRRYLGGGDHRRHQRAGAHCCRGEQPVCDVMFGGGVKASVLESCFEPYASPGRTGAGGAGPEGDSGRPFLIALVFSQPQAGGARPAHRLGHLLDPRWKGKIAFADPTVSAPAIGGPHVLSFLPATIGSCCAVRRPT